jgi:hypothetical protein
MGNSVDARSERWTFTEPWLIGILATVARQSHQKIGRRCFVTTEDIKQDLALDAFTDPVLLAQLRSSKDENFAKETAYHFAENARRRNCRRYMSKWPRLTQLRMSAG